jgi:hypothetical protein
VGVDEADGEELVDDAVLLEELLLGVDPRGAHVTPRSAASLKLSANDPLETPNFVAAPEAMVKVAL